MQGIEPRRTEPESAVLPLDYIPVIRKKIYKIVMAGLPGFEPGNAWTKTMCLTT